MTAEEREAYWKVEIMKLPENERWGYVCKIMKEISIEKKMRKSSFNIPTVQDIDNYCTEKGYVMDVKYFWSHYNEGGWLLSNGNPMKDWKSSVDKWKLRGDKFKNTSYPTMNNTQPVEPVNPKRECKAKCDCGWEGKLIIPKANRVSDTPCPVCDAPFLEEVV